MTTPGRSRRLFRRFEGDPKMQYHFHKWAMRTWLLTGLVAVPCVFFLDPHLWQKVALFFVTEISVYANWVTHLGSMSAAEAASEGDVSAFARQEGAG